MPKSDKWYCPKRDLDSAPELSAVVAGLAVLVGDAEVAAEEPQTAAGQTLRERVIAANNFVGISVDDFERRASSWTDDGFVDLTNPTATVLLHPTEREGEKRDPALMVRLAVRYRLEPLEFYCLTEIFTPNPKDSRGCAVVPVHWDPANLGGRRVTSRFYHVQLAKRGPALGTMARQATERMGHERLPRVPVSADSPSDLLRCIVLSLYGNGPLYADLQRSMRGAAPISCVHLQSVLREDG